MNTTEIDATVRERLEVRPGESINDAARRWLATEMERYPLQIESGLSTLEGWNAREQRRQERQAIARILLDEAGGEPWDRMARAAQYPGAS